MTFRIIADKLLTGFAFGYKISVSLIPVGIIWLLFFRETDPDPSFQFKVRDVSKRQQFIVPAKNHIHAISLTYEIGGTVDDSAAVSFRTPHHQYEIFPIAGLVRLHCTRDAYEADDIIIDYIPRRAKKGDVVIKIGIF